MDGDVTTVRLFAGESDELTPVEKAEASARPTKKAAPPAQAPRGKEPEEATTLAGANYALPPPHSLSGFSLLARRSSALRPCIAAYRTMIAGFGWRLDPEIDLEAADADDRVRKAILEDRAATAVPGEPTPEEVAAERDRIKLEAAAEKAWLTRFLNHCAISEELTSLRSKKVEEQERQGNAYWEVLRRKDGRLAYFQRVEATSVKLCPIERDFTMVKMRERVSPLRFEEAEVPRRFRHYVQETAGLPAVYFKEFGDPRPRGARTGKVYTSPEELEAAKEPAATELIHFAIFDPDTPYGLPRWIAAEYAVGGLWQSEEVNYYYFEAKAIPPGILAVSGGKLRDGAAPKIEQHLKDRLRGRSAFYTMMVVEADGPTGQGGKCKIEYIPLGQQQTDALFQGYERNCAIKVQQQFRLPDLLVGRSQEVNRAQADAVLAFAEQQVFQPLREEDDDFWNRRVFGDLGVRWWRFATNSAAASDPALQTDLVTKLVNAGILVPEEGRVEASEILNKPLRPIKAPWVKQPIQLTLANIAVVDEEDAGTGAPGGAAAGAGATNLAGQLTALRDRLRAAAAAGAGGEAKDARLAAAIVEKVDVDTFREWVQEDQPPGQSKGPPP